MNNSPYHWHNEVMVELERREIDREIANANLLREAGLAGTDWLTRARNGLVKFLRTRGRDSRSQPSVAPRTYGSRHEKAVE